MGGGRSQEVVALGGWTVLLTFDRLFPTKKELKTQIL